MFDKTISEDFCFVFDTIDYLEYTDHIENWSLEINFNCSIASYPAIATDSDDETLEPFIKSRSKTVGVHPIDFEIFCLCVLGIYFGYKLLLYKII